VTGGSPYAAAFGGIVLFLAAGRGLVALLPAVEERPRAARLAWAYLLGVACVPGALYLLGIAFDVRIRRGPVLAVALAFALAGATATALRRRRAPAPRPVPPRPPESGRKLARFASVLGAAVVAGLFAESMTTREAGWDSEMTWNVAARWIRADRSVTPRVLMDPNGYVSHPQYPVLMPVAQVAVQETFEAGDDPRVIKPLYAAFLPALVLVLFDLTRRHAGTAAASLAALALVLAPVFMSRMSGGAGGCYSDLPLGAFWGAGLGLLLGAGRLSEGVAAGLLLAAAVLTKNEGGPFVAVALLAGALFALSRRAFRARRLRAVALAFAVALPATAAVHAWKARIPQRHDEDYLGRLHSVSVAKEAASKLPLVPAEALRESLEWGEWNGFWISAALVLFAGVPGLRRRVAAPVVLALGGCLALYLAALVLSPWHGAEQVHPTWNRLLIQLTVPIGLLLALALRAALRARGPALEWLARADIIPAMPDAPVSRARAFRREAVVFSVFAALTAGMTWPWILHLRDYCSDVGDPYLNSWILWWDFHQTFHDPLHLFDGNIFFPYKLSLAFSEHNYGLALPLFPLFALGLRPLTATGILTLLGFAFSGYGAFRLARTLTGSTAAAWVSGIAFAFVPYRFGHLPHVNYLFSGWIPILLEAAVLFVRERTPKRAAWLGAAFFLNALAVIHWMVLTLVPLALTLLVLALRGGVERDRAGWKRAVLAFGVAGVALLPFLLPYQRASKLYGFKRGADEARGYSAQPHDWMNADPRNKLWQGFSEFPTPGERALFPGLLLMALPLAAILLTPRRDVALPASSPPAPNPRLLRWLDGIALVTGFVAAFAASPSGIHVRAGEREIFRATDPGRALSVLVLAVLIRWWLAYPKLFAFASGPNLPESLRLVRRPDALAVGWLLFLVGFLCSFGMHLPFHRVLYETIFLFKSVRVPARWSMIAYLGLALLAGVGVLAIADAWNRRRRRINPAALCLLACLALLFEDRAAPLELERGDVDPDEVTQYLAKVPMKGGIVELPSTVEHGNYRAVLRAADHRKPLITAVSGFSIPTTDRIEADTEKNPIPLDLVTFLENIPTSYIVIHDSWFTPETRARHRLWLEKGVASGRLVFVRRFDGTARNELYAVAKNEPEARTLAELPWAPADLVTHDGKPWKEDAALTGSIDEPAERAVVHGPLTIRGWAKIPGDDLIVAAFIDGEMRPPTAAARTSRPEVCTAVPTLRDCSHVGYEGTFPFTPGDEGEHEIVVRFRSKDGRERHYPVRRFVWKP
jgi:hypothetical protein